MAGKPGYSDYDDSDDDAFELLPAETLRELEEEAIRATQQPRTTQPATRPVLTSIQSNAGQSRQSTATGAQEELVNLDDVNQTGSYYGPSTLNPAQPYHDNQWKYGSKQMPFRAPSQTFTQAPKPQPVARGPDMTSLKATIQRLEREKLALKLAAQEAQSREQAKSGEAAILRETLTRSKSEYEQRIEALREAQNDAASKSLAEIQALQRAKEKMETDNKFLEHDLSVEAGRRPTSKNASHSGLLTTRSAPEVAKGASKKSSFLNVGDGFDEEEIFRQSPRKNRSFDNGFPSPNRKEAIKASTPSHRSEKRRRRDVSPTAQAELSFHEPVESPDFAFTPDHSFDYEVFPALDGDSSERLDFVERVMEHRVSGVHLLEALSKYSLPFQPETTFSGLVLDTINAHGPDGERNPAMNFCNAICEAWSQCLTEQYYEPLNLLVEALNFVVSTQRFTFLTRLLDKVVLLATQTIEIDAEQPKAPIEAQNINIKTEECLKLLASLAIACTGSQDKVALFWKTTSFKFVALLLLADQPLDHVAAMCELLTYSSTDTSFGPVFVPDETQEATSQEEIELWIAERLTLLLSEVPAHSEATPESLFPLFHILPFRLKVLDALAAMCTPPRGGVALVQHHSAIARLFEFLYEHVEALYSYEPTIVSNSKLVSLTVACINKAMFVIHQLLHTPVQMVNEEGVEVEGPIDVRDKLKAVNGGEFMHTIALTRLVFAEQPDLAFAELEPQELETWTHVGDAAHGMLDEFLSPDEGEMLLKMFSTSEQGTNVTNTATENIESNDVTMETDDEMDDS
jgi:Protein of unknown function (DUF3636)